MRRSTKNSQLQIRISGREKELLQHLAEQAGMDMSTYVLHKVLPPAAARFQEQMQSIAGPESSFAFAQINQFLADLSAAELKEAVAHAPQAALSAYLMNYIAAMVEYICEKRQVKLPDWTRKVAPLPAPVFGTTLKSLRLHLLTNSPPPFRFRNIFIDSTVGAGV